MTSIGVIIGSTRNPRICPQVAQFILNKIAKLNLSDHIQLELIDLKDYNLPLFDESIIPKMVKSSDEYVHEHTKLWSKTITRFDGFIFVTPQYNWGYPAALKNSIDFLYHEWTGKPAMIVTYGGHGGSKCNAQLKEVLQGISMTTNNKNVLLSFPDKKILVAASKGENLDIESNGIFEESIDDLEEAFRELTENLNQK
ncbi:similar to Saccharomyces cerevisiae YLR011W LOT6 FMN-dependent NAD(P)H:quinone reductase, may be involved in quinone detoxification [Maudiozyma saulgeensis]|uniref:FMN reductase [NAD(P)H] n=1 Tax=Maudiozyma saulgeensis TaxID=1789683 RepID=A0A1X7RB71_9SACH|nr:similar to Saccharomyces cerevisiae YLR011W LOT6 FMN-dependent NAD(P)H:quinone reductase, may be involved in quinone detoxification [Kazachstania saulgeensis]